MPIAGTQMWQLTPIAHESMSGFITTLLPLTCREHERDSCHRNENAGPCERAKHLTEHQPSQHRGRRAASDTSSSSLRLHDRGES